MVNKIILIIYKKDYKNNNQFLDIKCNFLEAIDIIL